MGIKGEGYRNGDIGTEVYGDGGIYGRHYGDTGYRDRDVGIAIKGWGIREWVYRDRGIWGWGDMGTGGCRDKDMATGI